METQVQILDKTVYISPCVNTLGKGVNSHPFSYGYVVRYMGLFNLSMAIGLGEKISEFKPVKRCLKIDLVSHLARVEGLDKYVHLKIHIKFD